MERAMDPVLHEEGARRDHLRVQGLGGLPIHLAEIGGLAAPDQGLEPALPGGAHDLDLEVPAAGRSPSVVGGAARGADTGVGSGVDRELPRGSGGRRQCAGDRPPPLDDPETIRKKIRSAVTDSGTDVRYDPEAKPGISNLLEIMSVATGEPIPELEARYDSGGYGQFKSDVAEAVVTLLDPIRTRYEELRADEPELRALLARGADKARETSGPTLEQMYERMGFVRP